MGIAAYCMYLGQGNLKNGFSKFLTQVSQGYFQVRTKHLLHKPNKKKQPYTPITLVTIIPDLKVP